MVIVFYFVEGIFKHVKITSYLIHIFREYKNLKLNKFTRYFD